MRNIRNEGCIPCGSLTIDRRAAPYEIIIIKKGWKLSLDTSFHNYYFEKRKNFLSRNFLIESKRRKKYFFSSGKVVTQFNILFIYIFCTWTGTDLNSLWNFNFKRFTRSSIRWILLFTPCGVHTSYFTNFDLCTAAYNSS